MSWQERLRECRYISPGGSVFILQFEELIREAGKKAPVTEFPGQNQGAVQDLGQATTRYPLVAYIGGENYDQTADRFWQALSESGVGRLEHPRYGNRNVTPVAIQQREAFVDGAGRAVFEIEFVETNIERLEYPVPVRVNPAAIRRQAELAAQIAAAGLEDIPDIDEPSALAQLRDGAVNLVNNVANGFNNIIGATAEFRAQVNEVTRNIIRNIDDLVQSPFRLATELSTLYALPLQLVGTVEAKLNGYQQLFGTLSTLFVDRTGQFADLFARIRGANANAALAAVAGACADGEIETREQAVEDAEQLSGFQSIVDGIDADYETKLAARQAVTAALLRVLEENLPIEQRKTLDLDEVLITLVDRLFTEIDDLDETIQFFIRYNRLQGDDIVVVPAGRTVRWYEQS